MRECIMFAVSSVKLMNQISSNGLLLKNANNRVNVNVYNQIRKFSLSNKCLKKSRFDIFGFKFEDIYKKQTFYPEYKINMKKIKLCLQKHTLLIFEHCYKQAEFILAHRLRRCQQIMFLYSRWWDELRLKLLFHNLRRQFLLRNKLVLSSSIVSCLNLNNEQHKIDVSLIQDSEFARYSDEINRVYALKGIPPKPNCNEPKVQPISHVSNRRSSPCKCSRCRHGTSVEGWVEIYNKDHLTFWKKEHLDHKGKGLYCYKVYGYFTDITAEDFLQVQINMDFRKEWDQTAIELKILDQDPKTQTDIVYWELRFPFTDDVSNIEWSLHWSRREDRLNDESQAVSRTSEDFKVKIRQKLEIDENWEIQYFLYH